MKKEVRLVEKKVEKEKETKFKIYEEFERLEDRLVSLGFVRGGAHTEAEFGENRCYFYSDLWRNEIERWKGECEKCEVPCRGRIYIAMIVSDDIFFDLTVSRKTLEEVLSYLGHGIEIYVNTRFAGIYCKKFNFLWATDWTHNLRSVSTAEKVVNVLVRIGVFKERNTVVKIKKFPNGKVIIGSDPEFELSEDWLRYSPVSQDLFSIDGEFYDPYGNVGADGARDQIEFRPAPSDKVRIHLKNLKKLIEIVNRPLAIKGDKFPLGCHIHFGVPTEAKKFISQMVEVLDDFLGRKLINLSGRARGCYKKLGAWEEKRWGFEYRSLPSAVLLNPEVTRIIFKIAKNVVQELLRRGRLVYNEDPAFEDYKKIAGISEREYRMFEEFCESYFEMVEKFPVVNGFWVKEKRKEFVRFDIEFKDDWSGDVKDIVKNFFNRRRYILKESIKVVFYGLKKERGIVVSGYKSKYAETIEHEIAKWDLKRRYVSVGLPWSWRIGELEEKELLKRLEEFWRILKEELRKMNLVKEVYIKKF